MDNLEIRALPIQLNNESFDGTHIQGVVNVPGSQSEVLTNPISGKKFREVIEPGTFTEALKRAKSVDFLYQHDKEKILSTTDNNSLELREDPNAGLVMSAHVTQTSWGKDAYQMIKDGIVKSMSFGMNVLHDTWLRGADGIPLRIIDKINLIEVSAVRNPAYVASAIEARGINISEVEIPDFKEERDLQDSQASEEQREAYVDTQASVAPNYVTFDEESKDLLKKFIEAATSAQSTADVEDRDDEVAEPEPVEPTDEPEVQDPEERSLSPEDKAVLEFFAK